MPENPGAVEARFYVSGYHRYAYNPGSTEVTLNVVTRGTHNKSWAAATPVGEIKMQISNESAASWFVGQLGKEIAVSFTPAPDEGS